MFHVDTNLLCIMCGNYQYIALQFRSLTLLTFPIIRNKTGIMMMIPITNVQRGHPYQKLLPPPFGSFVLSVSKSSFQRTKDTFSIFLWDYDTYYNTIIVICINTIPDDDHTPQ